MEGSGAGGGAEDQMSNVSKPFLRETDAAELLLRLYSVRAVEVKEFPSYLDRTFLVRSAPGKGIDGQTEFILKVLNADETNRPPGAAAAQIQVLDHLRRFPELKCQVPLATVEGKLLSYEMVPNDFIDGIGRREEGLAAVRLFRYIQGQPLDDVVPVPMGFYYKLGQRIGDLQLALQTYPGDVEPLKEKARLMFWYSENIQQIKHHLKVVGDPQRRALVEEVIDVAHATIAPIQHELRKGLVAFDCNHWNIIVEAADTADGTEPAFDWEISGLIDFDIMVHTALVYEIAIAMMYLMQCDTSPLECSAHLLAGFESRAPLPPGERRLLRVLIAGRFLFTLVYGLVMHKAQPDNESVVGSQAKGWQCLELIWKQNSDDLINLWDKTRQLYE